MNLGLNATYKAVLVNDMSTDNTVSAIQAEIKENDKFSLIHTGENGDALNSTIFGVNHASQTIKI